MHSNLVSPIESFSYITDNRSGIKRRCLSTSQINQELKVCGAAMRSWANRGESETKDGAPPLQDRRTLRRLLLLTKTRPKSDFNECPSFFAHPVALSAEGGRYILFRAGCLSEAPDSG